MQKKQLTNTATTAAKTAAPVYSTPCSKADKEYLLNESQRTGLSQKELVAKAIEALKAAPAIPNALPIKL